MRNSFSNSTLLNYLVEQNIKSGESLPTLTELAEELGSSVGRLREELAVARSLGLVSSKPRVGMKREQYTFASAIQTSINFGLATGETTFEQLSKMRRGIETSNWHEAVAALLPEDFAYLRTLIESAWKKLNSQAIDIPHTEHRELHLTIFKRLDNPFVLGLLTAYWDVYQANQFSRYESYGYWQEVWDYHEKIVEALEAGKSEDGLRLLIDHFNLLNTTPETARTNGHQLNK